MPARTRNTAMILRIAQSAALAALFAVGGCVDDNAPREESTPREADVDAPVAEPATILDDAAAEPLYAIECTENLDTGYVSGNPFPITVVTVDGKPVEKDTANAFYVMQQAAAADGVGITIVSGFRTMAQQQYLYGCYVNCNCNSCNLAAKPGYSNHQSGHALDLNTKSPGVYSWLAAHAGAYGFSETVQGEPWHWEWWGGGPGGGPCGSCEPHCDGSKIIGEDCGEGDCAVFGSNCVDDDKGPRCVFFACPAQGKAKVCIDETIIGDCVDGQISTGDCANFGAFCSIDLGEARCVSHFCAAPGETPLAHDGCFLDGTPFHCDELGQISFDECPEGQECSVYPEVHCEAGLGCPATGEGKVCVDTAIGTCLEGAVVEAGDCADFAAYCSTAGGTEPHCVSAFCVSGPDEVPEEHPVCLPDGTLGLCLSDGSMKVSECPEGTTCVEGEGFGAACVDDDATGGGMSDSDGSSDGSNDGSSGDGSSTGDVGSTGDTATGGLTSGGLDDDEAGCGCVAGGGPGGGPGDAPWLALLALGLWRRRARRRA